MLSEKYLNEWPPTPCCEFTRKHWSKILPWECVLRYGTISPCGDSYKPQRHMSLWPYSWTFGVVVEGAQGLFPRIITLVWDPQHSAVFCPFMTNCTVCCCLLFGNSMYLLHWLHWIIIGVWNPWTDSRCCILLLLTPINFNHINIMHVFCSFGQHVRLTLLMVPATINVTWTWTPGTFELAVCW